jgi:hypothetical protein
MHMQQRNTYVGRLLASSGRTTLTFVNAQMWLFRPTLQGGRFLDFTYGGLGYRLLFRILFHR